ncbi:MinD/ParA family ATP-binding protein [[Mycobacterium] nativiensis]|uniref:MinD/ParA family protein n=1 Tax=[Mycobacterium] nativiensis TaxID=2855503 RepID=A0ABU5XVC6_9MYCO|nr:MinD/ParA family protein [Mycolicibacter sp. MYC340]MEB3031893.1 MinD/ParA family protein [Mycolicibacter sp. MYC340]
MSDNNEFPPLDRGDAGNGHDVEVDQVLDDDANAGEQGIPPFLPPAPSSSTPATPALPSEFDKTSIMDLGAVRDMVSDIEGSRPGAAPTPPWMRSTSDTAGRHSQAAARPAPQSTPARPLPNLAPRPGGSDYNDRPPPPPIPGAGGYYPPGQSVPTGFGPGPGGVDSPRRMSTSSDDGIGASVGDLRAQIRESQVAPPYKPVPQMGWRRRVHRVTRVNLGLSATERHWNDLRRRLKVNLRGKYVIAVMGSKGGMNKTTATICLGMALKEYRDDKIVAIDANPASGNLARRIDEPVSLSWRGLVTDEDLRDYTYFRTYLGRDSASGLDVLGSDPGDDVMTGRDLLEAWRRLQVHHSLAIIDCGNQLRDDLTYAMLEWLPVNAVVVPSTTRLDGAQGAADTLNWLMTHGYPHLAREAVVIVSNINKVEASEQVRRLHEDFERTVRAVHDVQFDQHLSDAVPIEFSRMQPATRQSYIEAAASLVDGFAGAADLASRAGDPEPGRGAVPWTRGQGRP